MLPISDAELIAYLDDTLSEERRRVLSAALVNDGALRQRLEGIRMQRADYRTRMAAWGPPGGPAELGPSIPRPKKRWVAVVGIGVLLIAALGWLMYHRPSPYVPTPPTPVAPPPPIAVPPDLAEPPKREAPTTAPPASHTVRPLAVAAYRVPADWQTGQRGDPSGSVTALDSVARYLGERRAAAADRLLRTLPDSLQATWIGQQYRAHVAFQRGRFRESARLFDALAATAPGTSRDAAEWFGTLAKIAASDALDAPLRMRLKTMADPNAYHAYLTEATSLLNTLNDR